MKIEHLLELDATPNSALGRARAMEKEKADAVNPAVGGVPDPYATKGLPQPTTPKQPTTLGAPKADQQETPNDAAVWKNNRNPDAGATTSPTDLARLAGVKTNNTLAVQEPEQIQGTVADEPNTQVAPTAAKTGSFIPQKWVDNAKRSWDTATQVGRGINTVAQDTVKGVKNAADVAGDVIDTGGNLINRTGNSVNTAAQGVKSAVTGIGDAGKATGDAVANTVQGIGNAGASVGNAIADTGQGAANAVRSVGDIAGAATGAVTTPIGGFAGGFKRGYNDAASKGKPSGMDALKQSVKQITTPQQSSQASQGNSASDDELSQLKSTIQTMDQRMRNKGI
jgi:hypothetical protein